jgi:hypothetical protein
MRSSAWTPDESMNDNPERSRSTGPFDNCSRSDASKLPAVARSSSPDTATVVLPSPGTTSAL